MYSTYGNNGAGAGVLAQPSLRWLKGRRRSKQKFFVKYRGVRGRSFPIPICGVRLYSTRRQDFGILLQ